MGPSPMTAWGESMYLFSRQLQLQGDPRKSLAAAGEITALVNRKSDLQVSLWAAVLGAPVGSVAFSSLVQSRAEFDAQSSILLADADYLDKVAEVQQYTAAPPLDTMTEILHVAGGDYKRAEVGAVVELTTALITPGKYSAAFQWSIEMADLVAEIGGMPVLFGPSVGGPFGQVSWIGTAPNMSDTETLDQQLNKDPRYLAKLDELAGMFVDGSGQRTYAKRIA
jgi:hypothetical protein